MSPRWRTGAVLVQRKFKLPQILHLRHSVSPPSFLHTDSGMHFFNKMLSVMINDFWKGTKIVHGMSLHL